MNLPQRTNLAYAALSSAFRRGSQHPYRDWQYEEGMIQAAGTDVAPGFLLARTLAKTILDTGSGNGTFLGTAVYVGGEEVVLVSELEAGWYRYVSEWRLHAYGTPGPLRRRRRLSMIRLRVTSPIATAET